MNYKARREVDKSYEQYSPRTELLGYRIIVCGEGTVCEKVGCYNVHQMLQSRAKHRASHESAVVEVNHGLQAWSVWSAEKRFEEFVRLFPCHPCIVKLQLFQIRTRMPRVPA